MRNYHAMHDHRPPDPKRKGDCRHEPHLDTVAQKPTHLDLGTRRTRSAEAPHQDHQKPVPGAQPPPEPEAPKLTEPDHTAAGLHAIMQTVQATFSQMKLGRGLSLWRNVNKKDGFDCQSCAWPSPDGERHAFEFCENGSKAFSSEATTKLITPEFFRRHSVDDLLQQSDYWLEKQGRLVHPMVRREGASHYETIEWSEAFRLLANELHALPSPDDAAFYTSGRTSNEAAFLYQLFVRQFGTNNLPDCSNMCHESSGEALVETIGIGKGCVTLEDFDLADGIFIIGQNPGTNHPRMLTSLERAKHHGATIVSINPMPESGLMSVVNPNPQEYSNPLTYPFTLLLNRGTPLSDLWLPVRINGDMAALRGIMKEMLEADKKSPVLDHTFIGSSTTGFFEFAAHIEATPWDDILAGSGLTRAQIHQAAEIAMRCKRIICCWAMGLTQHRNAVATIQEVVNFLLLGGHIGRPGAGPCPVRGHSNVQGDRTMGIWERMNDTFMQKLGTEFDFTPPKEHGADTVETIKQMHEGKIRFFFGLGGNFLAATPDTEYTARALQNCRVTAHVSTKLNRAHLITGEIALILPCLGRSERDRQAAGEQFVTVEDSMGIINPSRGHLEPAGEHLLSEPAIVARLAKATLGNRTKVDWDSLAADYDRIRDLIEHVIPGFENFNERIRRDVFYLPNEARDKRKFNNGVGKAIFTLSSIDRHDLPPGHYLLMTVRSHDQFNTTIYGLHDRYRGVSNGRRVLFMNPEDMKAAGLMAGQFVDVTSHFRDETRIAKHFSLVPFPIARGCTATYFPEGNALVSINSTALRSNTPASKSILVTVRSSPDPDMALRQWREAFEQASL